MPGGFYKCFVFSIGGRVATPGLTKINNMTIIEDYLKKFYFKDEGKDLLINLDDCIGLIKGFEVYRKREYAADLERRKHEFIESLRPYLNKYGRETLNSFAGYWTEHEEGARLMRFELAKNRPFNIGRRLGTWNKGNKKNYGPATKKNYTDGELIAALRDNQE